MKNYVQPGENINVAESLLTHADSSGDAADGLVNGGDAVMVGTIPGVAVFDATATTDGITLKTKGVFTLSVVAKDKAGDSAVAIGDVIYMSKVADATLGVLNKNSDNSKFGVALGTVAAGQTAAIPVKLAE